MIYGALSYATAPFRECLRKRSIADDRPVQVQVQAGGRPTCTQNLPNYVKAFCAGMQKFAGQLLSVTAAELAGGAMPLLGTAIAESGGPAIALTVGFPAMQVLNTVSSWHAASVVQDAFALGERTTEVVYIASCVLPIVTILAVVGADDDDSLKAPVMATYLILGRMLTNALRDFFNEYGKGALGDTKHMNIANQELSKPDLVNRRGGMLVRAPFLDNVGSAALGQFVLKEVVKDSINVSRVATNGVADLARLKDQWKGTAASALASAVVKALYAFSGEWSKAYGASNDTQGGALVYVDGKGFKALRDNFGPKSKDAFQRWGDSTCTRNLIGPLSDAVSIWAKVSGGGTAVSVVASFVGGITEMRTPLLVDRAQAGRDTKRAAQPWPAHLPAIAMMQPLQPQGIPLSSQSNLDQKGQSGNPSSEGGSASWLLQPVAEGENLRPDGGSPGLDNSSSLKPGDFPNDVGHDPDEESPKVKFHQESGAPR